jgi:malonate transporter MadM subunit
MEIIFNFFEKNGLIVAFVTVGIISYLGFLISNHILRNKIPGAAVSILLGLIVAYFAGLQTGGSKGIADLSLFSGMSLLGGSMFRDFAIVSTAMGASFMLIRQTGIAGAISLVLGTAVSFMGGSVIAFLFGYHDAVSMATIGSGACTFIVGPVTGAALQASSEVIALSIATGVVKSILVTISTPLIAKYIGLNNAHAAMIYGGMMGTTSGVSAGLAATDTKLVPYGALTATFATGMGCLLCPSVFYLILEKIL